MADKKIIAVVGSTGSQGGGLVRAILGDPNGGFAARAITRDPNKDKAKALAAKGAEVVKADLDDVESLKKAFAGAYGVYGVTNFWEHFSGEKEKAQAKNIADAAKAAGVKHVIWSTLEDTRKLMEADDKRMPMLQEKYRVPHFDAKAEADAYFPGPAGDIPRDVVLLGQPLHVRPRAEEGRRRRVQLDVPDGRQPSWPASPPRTSARCAYGIFKAGPQYIGKTVGIAGENLTIERDGREALEGPRHRSRSSTTPSTPMRTAASDSPAPTRWATCSRSIATSKRKSLAARSADVAKQLNPQLQSFDQWLAKNKAAVPV